MSVSLGNKEVVVDVVVPFATIAFAAMVVVGWR